MGNQNSDIVSLRCIIATNIRAGSNKILLIDSTLAKTLRQIESLLTKNCQSCYIGEKGGRTSDWIHWFSNILSIYMTLLVLTFLRSLIYFFFITLTKNKAQSLSLARLSKALFSMIEGPCPLAMIRKSFHKGI